MTLLHEFGQCRLDDLCAGFGRLGGAEAPDRWFLCAGMPRGSIWQSVPWDGLSRCSGLFGMFAGTLLIGACLGIGHIASLMVIARDFRHCMSAVTGIYTAALHVGMLLTGALEAPLAPLVGWRFALASRAWLALLLAALSLVLVVTGGVLTRSRHRL
ncbi:hypothetical protein [Brachymonas sp.]|uniref:hypothetical protein n=1 Tax=Brachymonas sp. TaxID=1936292 RepID=UPI0035B4B545